jgi:hypothetical protein
MGYTYEILKINLSVLLVYRVCHYELVLLDVNYVKSVCYV